ncbi:MAG TPA: AI-2E family transporter [Chloroflexota bacterium]|nr:AI-2E family transporter [Chloroflexota bacterium]
MADNRAEGTNRAALSPSWQRALYLPLIVLAWLVVVLIAGWLLTHIARTLLTLGLASIIAYALTPLASRLDRWLPRSLAIAVAYILGVGVVLGLGAFIIVTAATQVTILVGHLPQYAKQLQGIEPQILALLRPFHVSAATLHNVQQQVIATLQGIGSTAARDSLGLVTQVFDALVSVVLVLILSVYLTANGPKIAQRLRRETPGRQRWRTSLLIAIVNQVVGGYIRGTLTMAALIGVLVGAGMFVLGVPYAALLGVLAFFMEFIPIIGVIISGTVCALLALFQGWLTFVLVVAYFALVHVVEGDVVGPRVMGKAVGIHPATALLALVAGSELFGFWGALFGAPLAGLLQAIGTAVWRELRGGDVQAVTQAVVEKEKQEVQAQRPVDEHAGPPPTARPPTTTR